MDTLNIELENCYGINRLNQEFDFSQKKIKNIYAPNGFMKSSFAKVFIDLSNNKMPKDEIYSNRIAICNVKDENDMELVSDNIFVIESYSEFTSKKISTLLVNEELKREYDGIYNHLEDMKKSLISSLKTSSGLTIQNIESEIFSSHINSGQTFFETLEYVKTRLEDMSYAPLSDIKYNIIFNDKVKSFLTTKGIQENLQQYIEKYNSLIEQSQYLQRDFTHNNVSTISTTLSKNAFFNVGNKINLKKNDGAYQEILSENDLVLLIENEKQMILTNPELQSIFKKIDEALEKNAELRNFRNLIENKPELIIKLNDTQLLKQDLWFSYFKENEIQIFELLEYYESSKVRLLEIIEEAKNQETDWHNVVIKFNQKFNVPFKLIMKNKSDVILNHDSPNISFIYNDGREEQLIDDKKLKLVLSNGEKRAFYILNLIFEIEARKNIGNDTLLIIDDIADSFDYKNKYAIIEYLKEILEYNIFHMIVLTHNFDFFRTLASRLDIERQDCFMTLKNNHEIKLIPAGYLKNVFTHWKTNIDRNPSILIASIPFVRNLVEYINGEDSPAYEKLTALLHIKQPITNQITLNDLATIFNGTLNQTYTFGNGNDVFSKIFVEADRIATLDENNDLENKITLSIAIRLKAEQFMIGKIELLDTTFVSTIRSNQTFALFNKYKALYNNEFEKLKTLGQVNLMTPENIHLNSFMYEPILDMSDRHLIKLYIDIKSLV